VLQISLILACRDLAIRSFCKVTSGADYSCRRASIGSSKAAFPSRIEAEEDTDQRGKEKC